MKKNFILEMLEKPFFNKEVKNSEYSSIPKEEKIEMDLSHDVPTGFFDKFDAGYFSYNSEKFKQTQVQADLIKSYRKIVNIPEVSEAVNEIVDEAVFSPGNNDILAMDFDEDIPQEVKDTFSKELKNISNKIKLDKNIYSMFLTFYTDGQLNIHCAYEENNTEIGISKISILSPFGLVYNYNKQIWSYEDGYSSKLFSVNGMDGDEVFDKEEIIRVDSGIYKDNNILSNLHVSIKTANMLNTLEDMLIPMRFSRSVSRRVFNVDVSNLNNKKAEEAMNKNQAKFAYSQFYDLETGTISNQQHISSLTEDYWFPNRGGEKGTTVDTIDETGNLGELGDIVYFKRKLYNSLKIPTNRLNVEGPGEGEFDYDTTSVSREEIKFFNFISRLRNQFLELFYELLKRELIFKNKVNEEEWIALLPKMKIKFVSENKFYEKMEREILTQSLSLYQDVEELIGKYFSHTFVFKKILKMSDDDIRILSEEIEKEKKDPLYARFYSKSSNENEEDNEW